MLSRIRKVYHEFPKQYWILVGAIFIDVIGGTLIWPFFGLYFTEKFNIGMAEAGILLGEFSLFGMLSGMIGGALADKFGRKRIMVFGLIISAFSMITLGLVNNLAVMYPLCAVVGLLANIGHPASNAMVADLLPEEKRQEGFGIMRVAFNLSWIIGPTIGGLLASTSYLALFIIDAVISTITALIVIRFIRESKPAAAADAPRESVLQTFKGYGSVIRNWPFVAYLLVSILMLLAYQQIYSTLAVYLRDTHSIAPRGYALLIAVNSGLVVLTQLWVTRKMKRVAPMISMAIGALLYGIGFFMFGLFSVYALFMAGMIIITVGEMINVPTSQSLVADFAPEDKRGRYMAFSGLAWSIPSTIGPWAAGTIMDAFDPRWVYYICAILCALAVGGFLLLNLRRNARAATAPLAPPVELTAAKA